jgi:hypothetical protein
MRILINENQLKNIIKEAIPYNIVKPLYFEKVL